MSNVNDSFYFIAKTQLVYTNIIYLQSTVYTQFHNDPSDHDIVYNEAKIIIISLYNNKSIKN